MLKFRRGDDDSEQPFQAHQGEQTENINPGSPLRAGGGWPGKEYHS